MRLFLKYFWTTALSAVLLCTLGVQSAKADAFSLVPEKSPLYTQLNLVQNAEWSPNIGTPSDAVKKGLTRYEFTVEIAKTIIDFQAHESANPQWMSVVSRAQLRALRALSLEFESELKDFNIDVQPIVRSIDATLRSPASNTNNETPQLQLNAPRGNPAAPTTPLGLQERPLTKTSLSERLFLYSGISMPNADSDASSDAITQKYNSAKSPQNTALRAGAKMDINDWLSLRAGYDYKERLAPVTLQQTLQSPNAWFPLAGSTSGFGGGLDVKVSPNLTLSGGVSRMSLGDNGMKEDISGTKLEGGLGVSGWDNRVSLSASLARLTADDHAFMDSTAGRINLDLALSNSTSVNFLYQQMFSLSAQDEGKSTFAGGVNIKF